MLIAAWSTAPTTAAETENATKDSASVSPGSPATAASSSSAPKTVPTTVSASMASACATKISPEWTAP